MFYEHSGQPAWAHFLCLLVSNRRRRQEIECPARPPLPPAPIAIAAAAPKCRRRPRPPPRAPPPPPSSPTNSTVVAPALCRLVVEVYILELLNVNVSVIIELN